MSITNSSIGSNHDETGYRTNIPIVAELCFLLWREMILRPCWLIGPDFLEPRISRLVNRKTEKSNLIIIFESSN